MVEVENNLEKERKVLLDLEKQLTKIDIQYQTIIKIDGEVDACLQFLRESVHVAEETQKKEQSIMKHKLEYSQLEQQLRDLTAQEDYLLRLKESNAEAQARQESYFLPKIEKAKNSFLEISKARIAAERIKSDITNDMSLEEKKAKTCVLERERMKRESDLQYIEMKELYELLNQDLVVYSRQLKHLLNEGGSEFISVM